MSTTSVTLSPPTVHVHNPSSSLCPNCGVDVEHPELKTLREAQARIEELESQVRILTLRATSAVERATEYETSLRRLNSTRSNPPPNVQVNLPVPDRGTTAPSGTPSYPPLPATAATSYTPTTPANPPNSRLARLLPTRAASNAAPPSTAPLNRNLPPHTPYNVYPLTAGLPPTEANLLDALNHEQSLRLAAESAAAQTNSEIEELTGQLFEQANEMVASERKARAKLEERVEVLEKRDNDKARRLGLLEMRVARVERVRGLLEQEKDRTKEKEAPKEREPEENKAVRRDNTNKP